MKHILIILVLISLSACGAPKPASLAGATVRPLNPDKWDFAADMKMQQQALNQRKPLPQHQDEEPSGAAL